MKTLTLLAVIALSFLFCYQAQAADGKEGKRLFHVVSLKFKPDATPEQIKAIEAAFAELKNKVPGVLTLDGGTDISPEKKAKGFTHCYVLTFASEKDRDAYAIHPAHKAFGALLGPVIADVMVIDFWNN
jgi:Stress responsive A/B Barrel Domain